MPSPPRRSSRRLAAALAVAGLGSAALAPRVASAQAAPALASPSSAGPAAAAPAAGLPAAAALTLEQALARALERSPVLAAAGSGREVAAARLRAARAWENPTLSIEAENVLGRGEYADFDAAETTVALSQRLPFGGGRAATVRGARAGSALALVDAELAARAVRRDVAVAYAEAVAADRLAALARERARIGAATREAVEQRFRAGLESELQRSRVEVETSDLQAGERRAAAEAVARRRALAAHWRADAVTEPLDEAWFDAAAAAGSRSGAAEQGATDGHPALRRARLALEQAQAGLDAARGARVGALEATVGTRRFGDAPADDDRAWVLGLSMPLPLWDRNGLGIAEARASLLNAEIEAENAARELEGERLDARAELDAAALETEALVASGLPAAGAAARLAAQGYEAGRLSLLERLEAERSLAEVRERLVRARLGLRRAEARLASLQ